MELEVTIREEIIPFIDVKGEIDVYTTPKLKMKITELLEEKIYNFAINLQEVSYIDSTGLGALIGALRRTRENNGKLYLIFSSPRLKRIFEVTGLIDNFIIYEKEEELLKELKKDRG